MCVCVCVCVCVCARARECKLGFHTYIHTKQAHSLVYLMTSLECMYVCTFTVPKPWDLKLTYNNDGCHTVSSKLQVLHTLTVAELVQNFFVKKFLAFSKTPCTSKAIHTWHFVIISNSAVLQPSSRTLGYGTACRQLLRLLLQQATLTATIHTCRPSSPPTTCDLQTPNLLKNATRLKLSYYAAINIFYIKKVQNN